MAAVAINCNFASVLKYDAYEEWALAIKFDPYHDAEGKFASKAGAHEHAEAFGKAASAVRDKLPNKSSIINHVATEHGGKLHVSHTHQFASTEVATRNLEAIKKHYAHVPGGSGKPAQQSSPCKRLLQQEG